MAQRDRDQRAQWEANMEAKQEAFQRQVQAQMDARFVEGNATMATMAAKMEEQSSGMKLLLRHVGLDIRSGVEQWQSGRCAARFECTC